eukprot:GHVR01078427.1.p1 GENE.GHVR01078427.1~~GHVR01078427.1.p1  ORF type:complete len:439 (+),score=182.38 GHVR01078427.1:75-1391(+)
MQIQQQSLQEGEVDESALLNEYDALLDDDDDGPHPDIKNNNNINMNGKMDGKMNGKMDVNINGKMDGEITDCIDSDMEMGDIYDSELFTSVDVITHTIQLLKKRLTHVPSSSTDDIEGSISDLECKLSVLNLDIQRGCVSIDTYTHTLKERIIRDNALAETLKKHGRHEDAAIVYDRIKIAKKELDHNPHDVTHTHTHTHNQEHPSGTPESVSKQQLRCRDGILDILRHRILRYKDAADILQQGQNIPGAVQCLKEANVLKQELDRVSNNPPHTLFLPSDCSAASQYLHDRGMPPEVHISMLVGVGEEERHRSLDNTITTLTDQSVKLREAALLLLKIDTNNDTNKHHATVMNSLRLKCEKMIEWLSNAKKDTLQPLPQTKNVICKCLQEYIIEDIPEKTIRVCLELTNDPVCEETPTQTHTHTHTHTHTRNTSFIST